MTARKLKSITPPPSAVVQSLARDEPLNRDSLLNWYLNDAPSWIREKGVPMDLAVFIWNLPEPKQWDNIGVMFDRRGR